MEFEFVSFFWAAFVFGAIVMMLVCGLMLATRERYGAFFFLFFAIILLFFSGRSSFDLGRSAERRLDQSRSYLVIAKGQSSFGTPLSVHDMTNGEDRIIVAKEYPPVGFVEAVTADGKTMLLPKEK